MCIRKNTGGRVEHLTGQAPRLRYAGRQCLDFFRIRRMPKFVITFFATLCALATGMCMIATHALALQETAMHYICWHITGLSNGCGQIPMHLGALVL